MSIQIEKKNESHEYTPAEFTVLFDDEKARITSWRFDPGTETGWHHHNIDYVTIQQSGGQLKLESDDGEIKYIDYKNYQTAGYAAPIKHNATNVSDEEVRVIEIEYKV